MNRIEDLFADPLEPAPEEDYYIVETHYDSFVVSAATAAEVERALDHLPPPRWLVFRSATGARHRVLTAQVYRVSESTAAQRSAARAFARAREREEKNDRRPWDDE